MTTEDTFTNLTTSIAHVVYRNVEMRPRLWPLKAFILWRGMFLRRGLKRSLTQRSLYFFPCVTLAILTLWPLQPLRFTFKFKIPLYSMLFSIFYGNILTNLLCRIKFNIKLNFGSLEYANIWLIWWYFFFQAILSRLAKTMLNFLAGFCNRNSLNLSQLRLPQTQPQ